MKILAFSDLHGDELALRELKSKIDDCDFMVCAGDLTIRSNGLMDICKELNSWGKEILIVPGNNEKPEAIDLMSKTFNGINNIHEKIVKKGELNFAGIGGGLTSIFKMPFENSEKNFKELLQRFNGVNKLILISHTPPYGILDEPRPGEHLGSKELLNFVKESKPLLVLCGHCHEHAGKEELSGSTRVINLGKHGMVIKT